MKPCNQPYREGTWFAVPLRKGGFAVGRVARAKGGLLLGYFFGPSREEVPPLRKVEGLKPNDAIRVFRVADTGLVDGEWPIIGNSDSWDRSQWPMPPFVMRDPIRPLAWRRHYSDTDPGELLSEEPEPLDSTLERSARRGFGAAEIALTKALTSADGITPPAISNEAQHPMGPWKTDSFGSDDALDWLLRLESAGDLTIVYQSLHQVLKRGAYPEVPECSAAIAAAEVVAALLGRASPNLPPAVTELVTRAAGAVPSDLPALALRSLDVIVVGSELLELWDESGCGQHWRASISDLRARLNYSPESPDEG